jgi:uncharacterized protein with ParB-like and HNH nuclease domain
MAFQTPITVKEAVDNVAARKYLLPAIQREVVWDTDQIRKLFDSLMRDYPIGSFLFWHVDKKDAGDYQFYEFMRDYHERDNRHNVKASVGRQDDITGILDGQQRLTSLYIGLKGSYAYKEPRKRWDNLRAFPTRRLYLNLLSPAKGEDESGLKYDFQFLKDGETESPDDNTYWFRVSDILRLTEAFEVNNYLIDNGLTVNRPREQSRFANETLFQLFSAIHKNPVINYFLERDKSLDKVLNIFIRVNSGGTELSYSDLLLSIATAQWQELDAREEITSFVDELNSIGDGYRFDKDFVLKSCLVLSDFKDIRFKVDNFNKANMLKIEEDWEGITQALRLAVVLISSFGYGRDTLTANYAAIPLAYYLKAKGLPENFDVAARYAEDRGNIRTWLIRSLVKRVFGGVPDTVLRPARDIIGENNDRFPLELITERFKGSTKSLAFTKDDVENLLYYRYGQGYTFSTLALLYSSLDFRNKFHIDHIHPKSSFTRARLRKRGIPDAEIDFYMDNVDRLPNLQLLEGIPNQEKGATDFSKWLKKNCGGPGQEAAYKERHMIPDADYSLANFREFFTLRQDIMRTRLREALGV